jgi:hypothetical protein
VAPRPSSPLGRHRGPSPRARAPPAGRDVRPQTPEKPFPRPPGSDTIPITCRPAVPFTPFFPGGPGPLLVVLFCDRFSDIREESEFYQMSYGEQRKKDRDFGRYIKSAKKDLENL